MLTKCSYSNAWGFHCNEEAFPGSDLCVLHLPFPGKQEPLQERIKTLKQQRLEEKIQVGDFEFRGTRLVHLRLDGQTINENLHLMNATILEDVNLRNSVINGNLRLDFSTVGQCVDLLNVTVHGTANFGRAKINTYINLSNAQIDEETIFSKIEMHGDVILQASALNNVNF